jgi:DNA-binding transcriptional MerR regulator
VLRFWETRFKEIEPVKRAGGRRFYRQRDVELVAAIRHLLYGEGYTIKGVQRILKEQGARAVIESVRGGAPPEPPRPEPDDAGPPAAEYHASAVAPAPEAPEVGPRALDHEDARRLRAALEEIAECKRLLTLTRR